MNNSKSLFTNTIPFENSLDVDVYFKSARLDTRVSFLRYSTIPRLIVRTLGKDRAPRGYIKGVDYSVYKKSLESGAQYTIFSSSVFECETFEGYLDLLQHAINSLTEHPSEHVQVEKEESLGNLKEKTFSVVQKNGNFVLFFPEHAHRRQYFEKRVNNSTVFKRDKIHIKKFMITSLSKTVSYYRLLTSRGGSKNCYNIGDCTHTPRLVKIFCTQLEESRALTSDSRHLLAVVPYKSAKYYNHTAVSSAPLRLRSHLSSICFKLTDENNRQLDLLTGVPSFVHFLADPHNITMSTASCYFSSGNALSVLHYRENSQSAFKQVLSSPIDSRRRHMIAVLHNIYIPHRLFSLSYGHTHITLDYDMKDIQNSVNSNSGIVKIPHGSYTKDTFLEKFNLALSNNQIKIQMYYNRIRLDNTSESSVNILFPPELAYMLGIVNYISPEPVKVHVPSKQTISANHLFKPDAVRSRIAKVTCNILSPSVFAGKHQQILRVLDLEYSESKNDHEKGDLLTFPAPHEVKIREGLYNEIEFELLDENDTRIEFEDRTIPVEGFLSIQDIGEIQ